MATPGDKLRYLRTARRPKLTQDALAAQLGLTRNQLANIESDRTELPEKVARKLSRLWEGIPEGWFYDGGSVEPPNLGHSLTPGGTTPAPNHGGATPGVGRRMFPIVGVAGAASFPVESHEEWGDYVEFSDDLYRAGRFAIRVVGDSMEDRLRHGDYVLVQPDSEPPYGLLTVAENDAHEYIVKVRRKIKGEDTLCPINEHYEAIVPGDGWRIVGYVVGIREERGKRKYREEGDDDGLRP